MKEKKCLNCGGEKILSGVRVVDRGHGNAATDLTLQTYENPLHPL